MAIPQFRHYEFLGIVVALGALTACNDGGVSRSPMAQAPAVRSEAARTIVALGIPQVRFGKFAWYYKDFNAKPGNDVLEVKCAPNWHVVSGGYLMPQANGFIFQSEPYDSYHAWVVGVENQNTGSIGVVVDALCYSG
jgi:hypothetical protein